MTTQRQTYILFLTITLSLFTGCSYVRHVHVSPGRGGVLAVHPPHHPKVRRKARRVMRRVCRGGVPRIVRERNVEVDLKNKDYSKLTIYRQERTKHYGSTARFRYERKAKQWQITYVCEGSRFRGRRRHHRLSYYRQHHNRYARDRRDRDRTTYSTRRTGDQ